MPTFTYTNDIPDANNNPSTDQPNMKTNTNSINSIIGVDHYSFGTGNDGYHNAAHFVARSDPSTVSNTNIVYSKSYTPDTTGAVADIQLFSRTAGGTIAQLTGSLTNNNNDGWAWVGGILIQWGRVNFSTSSGVKTGTVTFKDRVPGAIPFPNKCFEIASTLSSSNSSPPIAVGTCLSIPQSQIFNTSFVWRVLSNGDYNGFGWIAIGN